MKCNCVQGQEDGTEIILFYVNGMTGNVPETQVGIDGRDAIR